MDTNSAELNVFLQTHLPCDKNLEGLPGGRTKEGVSRFGRLLASYITLDEHRYGKISVIVSSTLPRAVETAELCFRKSNVPIRQDERLCPVDYGLHEERPMSEILKLQANHVMEPFPQGESYQDMADRYLGVLNDLIREYPGERVLLIGHGESRTVLMHHCQGIPLAEALDQSKSQRQVASNPVEHYSAFEGPFLYRV